MGDIPISFMEYAGKKQMCHYKGTSQGILSRSKRELVQSAKHGSQQQMSLLSGQCEPRYLCVSQGQ